MRNNPPTEVGRVHDVVTWKYDGKHRWHACASIAIARDVETLLQAGEAWAVKFAADFEVWYG